MIFFRKNRKPIDKLLIQRLGILSSVMVVLAPTTPAKAIIPFALWVSPCSLDASWTPQHASIIQYNTFKMNAGSIANGATISSEIGASGTATNAGMSYVVGKTGQGISFNGSNNYITMGNVAAMNSLSQFSAMIWMKTTSMSAVQTVFGKELQFKFEIPGDGSHIMAYVAHNSGSWDCTPTLSTTVSSNTWVHLTMTYNGTIVRLYVNGAADVTCALSGAIASSGNPYQLSGWGGGANEVFSGILDEVTVWNKALTAAEITKIYSRQTTCFN
jgi:hypothetical protein